jgi:hypothetical protein
MPNIKKIRNDERLIVPLDIDVHEELHRNVAAVPSLTHDLAGRAFTLFRDYGDAHDPIDNLQNYMASIEEAAKDRRVKELERSMAELTVWACELQIPWIQQGYVDLNKYRGN